MPRPSPGVVQMRGLTFGTSEESRVPEALFCRRLAWRAAPDAAPDLADARRRAARRSHEQCRAAMAARPPRAAPRAAPTARALAALVARCTRSVPAFLVGARLHDREAVRLSPADRSAESAPWPNGSNARGGQMSNRAAPPPPPR
jgi:hypothetical protein